MRKSRGHVEKYFTIYLVYFINYFIFAKYFINKFIIMETQFTEKESLELIGRMIGSARNNLQKGSGNIFLLWGYLVAGISLLTFILLLALPPEIRYDAYLAWAFMAVGGPVHYKLVRKMDQQQLVKTYIDRIMDFVWIAFSISIVTVIAGMLIQSALAHPAFTEAEPGHEYLRWFPWAFITPVMLCLYGFALFVSGKAYQFKPLVTGGIICWGSSLLLLAACHHPHLLLIQPLVLFLCAVAGFVVPGHLLKKKEHSHV